MATEPKKKSFWSSLFGKKDPEPTRTDATEESAARPESERLPESATLRAEEPAKEAPEEALKTAPERVSERVSVDAEAVEDALAEPVPVFADTKSSSHKAAKRMMVRSQSSQIQKKAKRLIIPHKKEKASEEENTAQKKRVQKKTSASKKKEAPILAKESVQPAKKVPKPEKPAAAAPAPAPVREEKKQGFFASLFSSKKSEPVKAPEPPVEQVKKEEPEPAPAKKSRIDFMRKRAKHSLEDWRQAERARVSQEMSKDERMWAQLQQEVPKEPEKTQDKKIESKKVDTKPEWTSDVRKTPAYSSQASNNILENFGINGLILALFLLCIQTIPDILHATKGTSLFSPAEFANIKAYLSTAASGLWIAPTSVMPAQWPGFYWLSTAIAQVLPNELLILTLSTLAGTALAVIATWILCRGAYGGTTATAASLILVSTPLFAPVVHFYGPAALAGAFVLLAIFFFSRGWLGDGSWLSLPLAFICTAIAGLTGGLFHLLLPLITSFFFLIWCGRYRRAQRSDAIFGFFCFIAIIAGWFGYMYVVVKNGAYINSLLRSSFTSPLALANWWTPFLLLLAGTLPWLIALIFPSWIRVIATSIRALKASQGENAASTFIWFSLAVGLGLAVCVQKDAQTSAIVCLLFIMVPLLAKTVVRLSKFGARLFIFSCMLLLFVVGLVFLLSYFPYAHEQASLYLPVMPPKDILSQLTAIKALPIIGGILLVAALYLKTSLKRGDTGRLAITGAFLATILTFPANFMLVRDIYKHPMMQLQSLAQIKAPAAQPAKTEAPKKAEPAAPAEQKAPAAQKAPEAQKPAAKEAPKPAEAQKTEAPKPASAPKTEAPKAEAPKPADAPKTEAPKAEAPKPADAPKTEAPKAEAPKTEAPKTEAPKPADAKPAAPQENAPSKPAN
ncbi:MAG: hypothetical protein IJU76_09970 [Desulfovibrionaceae bacterium]|nr:hypothetical protein [Desulfovibrionaceae bacterium]